MAIKQSEGRHSLKQKLHERKLYFEDKELDDALIKYNYFNFYEIMHTYNMDFFS